MRITAYAKSDVGRHREGNEDNMFSGSTVFAVADGMGGHVAGEVASETALRPVAELDGASFEDARAATDSLRAAIEAANRQVVSQAQADPNLSGMGTTLTAVMVREGHLHLAHVGDSRAYLLRDGEAINQLTTDHTLVEQLVQDGRLSRDEVASHPQRSVITRAIGVEHSVDVDTLAPLVLQPGDQVLLCSDGLTGPVSDEEIAHLLTTQPDGDAVVEQLIQAANDAGGPDNITVVLLRVEDDGTAGTLAVGDADDEADDQATGPVEVAPPPKSIPIRTRPESEHHDWATDMSRYGDRQGVDSGTGLDNRPRGRRILAVTTGVLVLVGVLIAGGYLILSRAYFIGPTDDETVGIFRGLNASVAGIALYSEVTDSGLAISSLPDFQQTRIREGITVGDVEEAEETVDGYREELEDAGTEGGGAGGGSAGRATDDPTPAP